VPRPRKENAPVAEVYESGKVAESEVDEILLLKVVQSPEARKPFVEPLACEIESVFAEKERGEETIADVIWLVPLPVRSPPSVVEAVPPFATATAPERKLAPIEVVATIAPAPFVSRSW
jgi:hypothetical protein